MWLARGQPATARRLFERALSEAQQHPGLSTTGDLHAGLADVLREQDELDAAEAHLEAGRALGEYASLLDQQDRGDFELLQLGWSGLVDPDANIYNFVGTTGSPRAASSTR